jgi:N-acetylglutamate synthase
VSTPSIVRLAGNSDRSLAAEIEQAAMRAWTALEQVTIDGWLLRFGEGYTKRANSVTAYGQGSRGLEEHVARCEALYRQHALPPIFRLPEPWAPAALDPLLAGRGYERVDGTRVLALDLAAARLSDTSGTVRQADDVREWLGVYQTVTGDPEGQRDAHGRILEEAQGERLLAWIGQEEPLACALGIVDGDYLGLYDIAVRPEMRGRGLGTALVSELLRSGAHRGARWAYLQVTDDNHIAGRLYNRLGFTEVYRYWYRRSGRAQAR